VRSILQAKSLLPALLSVAALAVAVNLIEVLCTAGLPAIYTAVLAKHDLSPLAHYGYLALYILGYMADDTLMVGTAVVALSSRKLSEKAGRWLKLLSGAVMLGLGLVLLLHAEWLS
jgi:threonine/homoserine/homoserine lactone efflux protein